MKNMASKFKLVRRFGSGILFSLILMSGCQPSGSPAPAGEVTSPPASTTPGIESEVTPTPVQEAVDQEGYAGEDLTEGERLFGMSDLTQAVYGGSDLPNLKDHYFTTSGNCTICHREMEDQAGNNVSTDIMWRASMMANASKDPYWQATVKSQIINVPGLTEVIEDKCATCHMPMARFSAAQEGEKGEIFDQGFADPDHPRHPFAYEGVSCTLCHQIEGGNFGQESSFSGHFQIDAELPHGSRLAYGPYPAAEKDAEIMAGASGFLPEEASHVNSSALCAVCHTLYTPFVNEEGEVGGSFPEQVPYLEWRHSEFAESKECQDCHMPIAEGGVVISTTSSQPRSPFYQHLFIGGNAYVLRIFHDFGEEIGVTASAEHFKRKIYDTLNQLQTNAAQLDIEAVTMEDSRLKIEISVENHTGHKFPTAFPSRRAWIHVVVQDGKGATIFESGGYDEDGSILENDNDNDPAAFETHYNTLNHEDQVQIYEAILNDVQGETTTVLLHAASFIKDNRLLPRGFDKKTADADIQVFGAALEDGDFRGGRDKVTYLVDVDEGEGPFRITARLLYQSIGYRWAANLADDGSQESALFLQYYAETPNWPVFIAGDERVFEGH